MLKKFLFIALLLSSFPAFAEERQSAFEAEDFATQSLLWVQNSRESGKCHAVRILPKWYLTAAHCVSPVCNKECTLTLDLLQGNLQASARVQHTASDARVFVPREYIPRKSKSVRHDVALIRFDPKEVQYSFYDAKEKEYINEEQFLQKLKLSENSEQRYQWNVLSSARPKLLTINAARHMLDPLAVPTIQPDGIYYQESFTDDFYYFTELRHFMGSNFGVVHGMSGGGVVVPGGDIVGIVSGKIGGETQLTLYDNNDKPIGSIPYSSDYFLFTPFNRSNVNFIRATIASFHESGSSPRFVGISGQRAELTQSKPEEVFGNMSAEDIADVSMAR